MIEIKLDDKEKEFLLQYFNWAGKRELCGDKVVYDFSEPLDSIQHYINYKRDEFIKQERERIWEECKDLSKTFGVESGFSTRTSDPMVELDDLKQILGIDNNYEGKKDED